LRALASFWKICPDASGCYEAEPLDGFIAAIWLKCRARGTAAASGAGSAAMTKKKPRYESRVFDGRIIHSAEIERIHKEVLDFKHIEAISEPTRELIEDLLPELVSKLPPKRPHG
jgi:hypothetical protein